MLNEIDLSRTDLNLLVIFEAVLAEGHVGRAAARLRLTPSAISHGLGRLRRLLNDPLFLRNPRGVTPTARALALAPGIAEALAGVRRVLAVAEPFDPATSTRRFTIGAPDGVSAVILPPLLARLADAAPGIDLSVRQLLPIPGEVDLERAWRNAFDDLERRRLDLAVIPSDAVPARFHQRLLYAEHFVVAARAGHPFLARPSLAAYCRMRHLVVSEAGDPFGFVDQQLEAEGLSRRVALTVPNFFFALATLADSDLISALPARLVEQQGARAGIDAVAAPMPLAEFRLNLVAPKVALMDEGLAWLADLVEAAAEASSPGPPPTRSARSRSLLGRARRN